jgi:hypothetical protein
MYINHIEIENFRTFRKSSIDFCHPDQDFKALDMPKPKLPNINLLLGNNGFGKTSLLKAIALSALGPLAPQSGIYPYRLVRRETGDAAEGKAVLKADFTAHPQDHSPHPHIESHVEVEIRGDQDLLSWQNPEGQLVQEKLWHPIFNAKSDAFFIVGYGATRRVGRPGESISSSRSSERAARVMGLFEDEYALRPLNDWLPEYQASSQLRGRAVQAINLVNDLLGKGHYEFKGELDNEKEYLFERKGVKVPFPALSDGYRAFLGWIGDLLYHVCETCPSGKKLVDNHGIVMVDEVDLHLHPKWQMTLLGTLARTLPNIQFIVTSHSPLLVGSLEWMNIIAMQSGPKQSSIARRLSEPVHGLDADQVLLTDFFGLESTRAEPKNKRVKQLTLAARDGDNSAAEALIEELSAGIEEVKA